jgi:hypothetical protein
VGDVGPHHRDDTVDPAAVPIRRLRRDLWDEAGGVITSP